MIISMEMLKYKFKDFDSIASEAIRSTEDDSVVECISEKNGITEMMMGKYITAYIDSLEEDPLTVPVIYEDNVAFLEYEDFCDQWYHMLQCSN